MLLTCAYLSGCVSMLCVHTHLSAQLLLCKSDPIVQLLLCRLHPIVHCSGNAVNIIFLKSIWTKAWFDKIGKPELAALACYCCSMAIPQQWQQPTLFFLAILAFYIVHCLYFCLVYIGGDLHLCFGHVAECIHMVDLCWRHVTIFPSNQINICGVLTLCGAA